VVRGVARQINRRRLGIALTILGLVGGVGLSVLCVIYDELLFKVLAVAGTLILALGLTLFVPLRFIEEGT